MDEIKSRPYKPQAACERCVFNTGPHADWCKQAEPELGPEEYLHPALRQKAIFERLART